MAAAVEGASNPSHEAVEGGVGTSQVTPPDLRLTVQIAEKEMPFASAIPPPLSAESIETQIKETTDEKWKYIACGLSLFGPPLPFFAPHFTHFYTLSNLLTVMICLFVFSAIFGAVSFIGFQKISVEEQFKSEASIHYHQISGYSVQRCLFLLFVFVAAAVYVLVAVNAISEYVGAHKP